MKTILKRKTTISNNDNLILVTSYDSDFSFLNLSSKEYLFLEKELKLNKESVYINQYNRWLYFIAPKVLQDPNKHLENCRLLGDSVLKNCSNSKQVHIVNLNRKQEDVLAITEGLALGNYKYLHHKTKEANKGLKRIFLCNTIKKNLVSELQNIIDSVYICRDLVNEPFSHLKAKDLSLAAKKFGKESGYFTKIFNKKKIQELKMGGLLAVNQGSIDPPTFTIMEWNPSEATNSKPLILVGKGIVYDTGGLSLKPTANSMDIMKVDMAGGACVISTMYAIAKNNLSVHVIGLLPATDNRPSGNAYAPGDVVEMFDGTKVEVLNTDAEGRMILADALSFAKKYKPELVIDLATLTGSAARTIGHFGIVSMSQDADKQHSNLKKAGKKTHERLAEMPFWSDYDKLLESEVADIKNIGGSFAGAITAGKFLAHFTEYPWIHLDIAGPSYTKNRYEYRGLGATGMGVRLLYQFIKDYKKYEN